MGRREERGARLKKMVREGNRRNEILTGTDEKICIARLFFFNCCGGCTWMRGEAICSRSTIKARDMSHWT